MQWLFAFVLALAVVVIHWCLMGLLLSPVFGRSMVTLCFARGDGSGLEQQVRAYGWLREGKGAGSRLLLVDCGLDPDGLDLARRLEALYDWVTCCPRPALEDVMDLWDV